MKVESWSRYSEVAECQCYMNTVLDGIETLFHRVS